MTDDLLEGAPRRAADTGTPGLVAAQATCPESGCGQPRTGHPRKGWVKVHKAGDGPPAEDPWFCSWDCVCFYSIRRGLNDGRVA